MTNPYYDNHDAGGKFLAGETARGTDVDAKFDSVEAGFEGVKTDIDTVTALANAYGNYKGTWASLTGALNVPATVTHAGATWSLINNLADVTASEPGVTADWVIPAVIDDTLTSTKSTWSSQKIFNEYGWTETTTAVSKTLVDLEWVTVTAATQEITLMASPTRGKRHKVSVGAFADTVIKRNGQTIHGVADDYTFNKASRTVTFEFDGTTWGMY